LLHGYTGSDEGWFGSKPLISVPAAMDKGIASGITREIRMVSRKSGPAASISTSDVVFSGCPSMWTPLVQRPPLRSESLE
jgi:hypothetical protein